MDPNMKMKGDSAEMDGKSADNNAAPKDNATPANNAAKTDSTKGY